MMSRWLIIIGLALTFASCYDREDILDDLSNITRNVGPEGGTIEFYSGGFPGELGSSFSNTEMVARLEIPEGALSEEVVIDIVARPAYNDQISDVVWEFKPKDISFTKAVTLTYKYASDSLSVNWYCYGTPLTLPFDGNLYQNIDKPESWLVVDNFVLDEENSTVSLEINDFNSIYGFGLNQAVEDFYFCRESNRLLEIPLASSLFSDPNSVLVLSPDAMPVPSTFSKTYWPLFAASDDFLPASGDYYLLKPKDGWYTFTPSLNFNSRGLLIYQLDLDQYNEITLNWDKAYQNIKMLKIDPLTYEVLEVINPYPFNTEQERRLIGAEITSTGLYSPAILKSDFELWQGGIVTIEATGGSTDTTLVYEDYTFGGGKMDFFDLWVDMTMKEGKSDSLGYLSMTFNNYDPGVYRFPEVFETFFMRYYDINDNPHYFDFLTEGSELTVIRNEGPGGIFEGEIITDGPSGAYNELGEFIQLKINFEIRVKCCED